MSDTVYCPNCNYAMSKTQRDSIRVDILCPRCGQYGGIKVSSFYSVGSQTHKNKLEEHKQYIRDVKKGHSAVVSNTPPAWPEKKGQVKRKRKST